MADPVANRLSRIEGQVRGLARMVEDGADCGEVITLLSSIKGALDQVGLLLLREHAQQCFRESAAAAPERQEVELRRLGRVYHRFARS